MALLRGLAAAQKENLYARRAADRVKLDLDDQDRQPRLTRDELASMAPLGAHQALVALLQLDAGGFNADARALAILSAMDRMQLARGLPKHLKLFAVHDVYQQLFNVPPPAMTNDLSEPLPPGVWLRYLSAVAEAGGHAVPLTATDPKERDLLAWGDVLAGFADLLRAQPDAVSPQLKPIVHGTIRRLDAEYTGSRNYAASLAARPQ